MTDTQSNVTQITDKQPQPAAKFSITCSIDGFQVQVEVEGKADHLRGMIDRLKAIGAQPPIKSPAGDLKSGTPTCPEHGMAKQSRKPGFFYCPTALPDGGYCRWTGKA